jgi:hypothetical protein
MRAMPHAETSATEGDELVFGYVAAAQCAWTQALVPLSGPDDLGCVETEEPKSEIAGSHAVARGVPEGDRGGHAP